MLVKIMVYVPYITKYIILHYSPFNMHNMTRPNNIRNGARHDKILMIHSIWYDIVLYHDRIPSCFGDALHNTR
jgi:hypothetical protein